MKRFLSILLTVVLSLSVVAALPVYAEEGTEPFKVGESTYATLKAAYDALPDEGGVIELTANYTSSTDFGLTFAKPVTLKSTEGQKYTITLTTATLSGVKWITATAALTLKDVTVNMTYAPYKSSDTGEYNEKEYTLVTMTGDKLVLDNTDINYVSDLLAKNGSHVNTAVQTDVIRLNGGETTDSEGFNVAFEMTNGSKIIKTGRSSNNLVGTTNVFVKGKAKITIGENCSIKTELKCDNNTGVRPVYCILLTSSKDVATANITLASGSELSLGTSFITTDNSSYPGWIVRAGSQADYTGITVVDNGCTYKVAPDGTFTKNDTRFVPDKPVFHTVSNAEVGAMYYTADGAKFAAGQQNALTKGQSYEFKFGVPPAPLVANKDGASIRTDAPLAIRFGGTVNKDVIANYVKDGATVRFGIVITPNSATLDAFATLYETYGTDAGDNYICSEWTVDEIAGDGTYSLSMYVSGDDTMENVSKENLQKTFYGCAYYVITDANGNETVVVAENAVARSIYDVAKAYQEIDANNAYINSIVSRVDG